MPYSTQRIGDSLHATFRVTLALPIVLTVIGLLLFWLVASWYTVECVRQSDGKVRSTIRAHRIGWSHPPVIVDSIRTARVETASSRRSDRDFGSTSSASRRRRSSTPTHRVLLIDAAGAEHPVSEMRTSGLARHTALASGINRFLANPSLRRTIVRQPWEAITLAILLVPLLGLGIYLSAYCDCVIDRGAQMVHIKKWGLLGPRTIRVALHEVREFSTLVKAGRWNRKPTYNAVLTRHNGTTLNLAQSHSTDDSDNDLSNTINALERFRAESPGV